MSAPTCLICDYTGSKSRYIGGDLDCTACDAVEKRMALREHMGEYTAGPQHDGLTWRAYQFALAQQAPAVSAAPSGEVGRDAARWRFFEENFDIHFEASDELYDRTILGPKATIKTAVDAAISREKK